MDVNNGVETHHPHPTNAQEPSFPIAKCPDRSRRDEWMKDGVLSLLEVYESKWASRNHAKLKGSDWEDIARQVSVMCSGTKAFKTPSQCKNKIESMKKRYRAESVLARQPNSSSLWKFYPQMESLLKGVAKSPAQDIQTVKKVEADVEMEGQVQNSDRNDDNEDDDGSQTLPVNVNVSNDDGNDKKVSKGIESDVSAMMRRDDDNDGKRRKRRRSVVAESIALLAQSIIEIEQARLEVFKDSERMRIEAEIKRAEMELKRTEIITKTQLQIARLFSKRSRRKNKKNYNSSSKSEFNDQLLDDGMDDQLLQADYVESRGL
ncbi:putative transcription factor Trihelix family [Dioscorea sansibarensis]